MSGLKTPQGNNVKYNDNQPSLEDGNHDARVVRVLDLGKQAVNKGEYGIKVGHLIRVTYELPYEFMLGEKGEELEDKPRWVDEEFFLLPMSSDRAVSTARSKAIDPNGELSGDWSQYLGQPVVLTLKSNEGKNKKIYTKVTNATPMRKRDSDKLPELKNEGKFFDLNDPDMEFFKSLPNFLQAKICANLDFEGSKLSVALDGVPVTSTKAEAKEDKKEEAPTKKAEKKPEPEAQETDPEADVPW